MNDSRKKRIKALVNETLKRIEAEGLTVEEANLVAFQIRELIHAISNSSPFHVQTSDKSESFMTDMNSSANL